MALPKNIKKVFYVLALVLSALGLYGATSLSYTTFTGTKICPQLFILPACYVVALGYLGMTVALLFKKSLLFYPSWLLVFVIAFGASFFQMTQGNACPISSSGLPMCYLSLVILIIIFMSYVAGKKEE